MLRLRRTLLPLAVLAAVLVGSSPAQAAGKNSDKDVIHDCGYITCSDYYSHSATVQFDEAMQRGDFTPAGIAAAGCDLGAGGLAAFKLVGGEIIAIPCTVVGAAAMVLDHVQDIIHHAATTEGCMRFRHPRGADGVSVAVYADHSSKCHSMDD